MSLMDKVAESIDGIQPRMRDEPCAFKRAIARLAIEEYERALADDARLRRQEGKG